LQLYDLLLKSPQITGDGALEFLSFPTAVSLGIELAVKGNGRRIHQGKGPYEISFKVLPATVRVYFQVDGEFFIMTKPLYVRIRFLRKVNVLSRSKAYKRLATVS